MKHNFIFTAALLSSFLLLSACGAPTEADKIADAQNCLDRATPSTVDQCVEKVSGMETPNAYLIRCVGKFVKEGFNEPAKLAAALDNTSGNSGASGSTAMMAALAFKAESTPELNATSALEAQTYCTKANSKGLILLSGLPVIANTLASLGHIDPANISGTDVQNLMGTLQNNQDAQAAVGTVVSTIYQTSCSNNSSSAGNYCQQFESALTSVPGGLSNPGGIGQQIMICYNNPSAAGCTGF